MKRVYPDYDLAECLVGVLCGLVVEGGHFFAYATVSIDSDLDIAANDNEVGA